jgi:hypothetical protein
MPKQAIAVGHRRIFSSTQAAEWLGVSRASVIKLTDQGLLNTLPGFTQRMYAIGELERFVAVAA